MAHLTLIRAPFITSTYSFSTVLEPPLGLAYVAAALAHAGHRVTLIDATGEALDQRQPAAHPGLVAHGLSIPEILDRIPDDADAIGVSVMFSQQWPHAEAMIHAIHARRPATPIFVGGEHATVTWEYLLAHCPEITACALGEGEVTAVELAAWVDGAMPLASVAGIAYRDGGTPRKSAARARIPEPATIAPPAWHLVPLDGYFARGMNQGVNRGRSMPILATRGCPFQCTFCSSPEMWTTRYTVRPVAELVDEIEGYVKTYGIANVDFEDLTAFIKRDWILALCAEIERRGLRLTYQLPGGTRSEALDREVLEALYRTGCRNITYAPESGSERTLKRIKKKVRLDRMLDSMKAAVAIGMVVKVNMIIGFPFETRRDILTTVRFCLKLARLGVEDIPIYLFSPYPGTELYEDLRRDGILPEMSNDYFADLTYNDVSRGTRLCAAVGPAEMELYRILGMGASLVIAYATHPSRIWRTVRNLLRGAEESMVERRLRKLLRRQPRRHSKVRGLEAVRS
jgi:anaerobic magnesium-protoporphyrin IX monomethyl ester cyclase